MWTVYKTKPGDTMDTIIAKHKIRDPGTVLVHKANKKIYKDLKAGKELPKNTPVTIPDPKAKLYKVPTPGGDICMDEKTFKSYCKGVDQRMDDAMFQLKQRYTYATGRHDAQLKINKDQWFVAACIDLVNRVPEPKSRKKADSAFKTAEKACKSRNYKAFEKAVEPANIAIATYKNEVLRWIDGIINGGESSIKVLEGVKSVGMVAGSVAATTILAPVSVPAILITGAVVGGGTSLAYNGADALGREVAGTKQKAASEIVKDAMGGALGGAIGAGMGKLFMKFAGPHLVGTASNSRFLGNQVNRILSKAPINLKELYAAEVKAVVKRLGIASTDALLAARPVIMKQALVKFMTRVTIGSLNKYFSTGGEIIDAALDYLKKDPKRANGKDPSKAAKAFANEFMNSKSVDGVVDGILKDNQKKLVTILREEIKAAAISEMKKERA
ncbi:hypothetical protein [uncultured Tateyamaria sp.]|uniref:hypothetical protein n=1 Tax=uncultured Tateyamaria sp. TaxID=455651 RepID=UPI00261E158E|nr:hypothetical protein [uncultured Tateyamaria sp.]